MVGEVSCNRSCSDGPGYYGMVMCAAYPYICNDIRVMQQPLCGMHAHRRGTCTLWDTVTSFFNGSRRVLKSERADSGQASKDVQNSLAIGSVVVDNSLSRIHCSTVLENGKTTTLNSAEIKIVRTQVKTHLGSFFSAGSLIKDLSTSSTFRHGIVTKTIISWLRIWFQHPP